MNIRIGKYVHACPCTEEVKSTYLSADNFIKIYRSIDSELDRKILLRHIVRFNTPYVFRDSPLIYEQIRNYLADRLRLEVSEILIIGSAKTGFSMSTEEYGKVFSEQSDLDFTIVNRDLFKQLQAEYKTWKELYVNDKSVMPKNEIERKYWDENIKVVANNLKRGFVDCRKLPTRKCCPTVMNINDAMWLITERLKCCFNIKVTHSSARIYQDLMSFYNQFKYNTD